MDDNRALVMVVDDNVANLRAAKVALSEFYDVFTVPSAAKMFELLERHTPRLILLDVVMPEMDGFEAMKILKARPDTRDIPIVFLTGKNDPKSEIEGISIGAIDYIAKPFLPQLLYKRVELHLAVESQRIRLSNQATQLKEQREELDRFNEHLLSMVADKTDRVFSLQNAIISTVANLAETRDAVTGKHVERVQHGLKTLIDGLDSLGLYQDQTRSWNIDLLLQSSQLHDVGKIAISDSILNKPGRLTAEEFEEMKKHVPIGVRVVEHIASKALDSDFLDYARVFITAHHEKWDGSGYPDGLAGEDIPLVGRLMAIADVYDALVSERPYKKPFSHEESVQIILSEKSKHFDPVLTDVFEQVADRLTISSPGVDCRGGDEEE